MLEKLSLTVTSSSQRPFVLDFFTSWSSVDCSCKRIHLLVRYSHCRAFKTRVVGVAVASPTFEIDLFATPILERLTIFWVWFGFAGSGF